MITIRKQIDRQEDGQAGEVIPIKVKDVPKSI